MVDLTHADAFDEWFSNINEKLDTEANQSSSSSSSFSPSSLVSSNEPSIPVTKSSSLSNNEDETQIKKRKNEQKLDTNEPKKSKQTPAYMRRNIRHLLTNDKLQEDTLSALKAEQDRLKRLDEINENYRQLNPFHMHIPTNHTDQECIVLDDDEIEQKSFPGLRNNSDTNGKAVGDDEDGNDSDVQYVDDATEVVNEKLAKKLQQLHVDDRVNIPDENGNILVNINHPSDDPDLYISKHLCFILKPHQIGGIRFMYDNIVESLQRFQTTPGLGCILAHSMGCGKTIQVITFIDIFLRYTTARTVLIVVPINTIQNWASEFNRWSPLDDPNSGYQRPYQLYILNETSKKLAQRAKIIQNWSQTGGVLVMGYEMFRLLITKKTSQTSTSTKMMSLASPITSPFPDLDDEEKSFESIEDVRNVLINPDLVICDEGHRIKNHLAGVAIALKSIKTQRRIVLTGYPLQNNLIEYWCMVDFIRPNYLGSKQEFCNMFERPILNGQCVDSTSEDRQVMRARAHVLHSLLEGFIQRRGHDVLQTDLPPKTEYVILLKLSNIQRQLYMKFLEAIGALSKTFERTINPLRAFTICCKIWNHADVLYKFVRDRQDGSDFDFDLELDQNSKSTTKVRANNRINLNNRASPQTTTTINPLFETQTSVSLTDRKEFEYDFANTILNSYVCGQLSNGIKFEVALTIIDLSIRVGDKVLLFSQSLLTLNKLEEFLSQHQIPYTEQNWEKNLNYYRLDGSTSGLERERLINAFNAPDSNVKLFLLSTRAGCLGINLIAANRVIVLDVSWNPCLDAQAICRIYRYGQRKHCYIYRLIADFTMEKRIYDRQIAKQGMSDRVVDELQPQTQFTRNEVENLLHFAAEEEPPAPDLITKIDEISDDPVLLLTCKQYAQSITRIPFTHESLLSDQKEHQLTSAEKRRAQQEYQHQKQRNIFTNQSRFNSNRVSSFINKNSRFLTHSTRCDPSVGHGSLFKNTVVMNGLNDYFPPPYQSSYPLIEPRPPPGYNQSQTKQRKLELLKQRGVTLQSTVLQSPLEVKMNETNREVIPSGVKIYMIKSPRGSYVRTPDGRIFAVRQSIPTMVNNPQLRPITPQPPPPSTFFDDLLFDSTPRPSSVPFTSSSSSSNDLSNEIDRLIGDLNPTSSSSTSSLENFNAWHHDYFPDLNFYPDVLPNQSTSNPLTFI